MTHNRIDNLEWTPQLVAEHMRDAVSTIRKLPAVKVQGYFNSWPDIKHTPQELSLMEARPMRLQATPDAISRLEETFQWMQWLTVSERKLVWRRAANCPWKTICWELGCVQTTAWRKWMRALSKISERLNKQCS